jgi:hypothetical protein
VTDFERSGICHLICKLIKSLSRYIYCKIEDCIDEVAMSSCEAVFPMIDQFSFYPEINANLQIWSL